MDDIRAFRARVEEELLPSLELESVDPCDPVEVRNLSEPWEMLGCGNFAAVFALDEFPELVVKVYAPGRPGREDEAAVYQKLGEHPAYAQCHHVGDSYLILTRLPGVTFYDCLRRGIKIPEQAIRDIDEALKYARSRGLTPADVHAKNVMVAGGRGKVVDISEFGKDQPDSMWADLRRTYFRLYRPVFGKRPIPIPGGVLNFMRRSYHWLRWHSRST